MSSSQETRSSRIAARLRHGVTLFELVVVVSVVGVTAAVVVPRFGVNRHRADAAAMQVRTLMQRAQRIALSQQHDVIVGIDTAKGRLILFEDRNNDRVADAGDRANWHSLEGKARLVKPPTRVGGQSATGAFVGATIVAPAGTIPGVVFRRDGSANLESELYFAVGTGKREELRAVRVRRSPGRPDWYRYVGGTWMEGGR
jgi:prepilin-type N-terminal cleavage/methylation domain-containing protein